MTITTTTLNSLARASSAYLRSAMHQPVRWHEWARRRLRRRNAWARIWAIPALKYGMDLNCYYGGLARLPFLPLKAEVERLLADIRK
jgi:hypothetical protein